jgi:hypothetical protein
MAIAECGLPNELDASRLSAWLSLGTLDGWRPFGARRRAAACAKELRSSHNQNEEILCH